MNQIKQPLISIITVVFNGELHLDQAIKSVIYPFHELVEYIVVDGASTDKTLKIINRYLDEIDIFISESDDGIYDAMNKGAALASGKFIGFLNADDYFHDSAVLNIIKALSGSDCDVLYSDLDYINSNGTIARRWISGSYYEKKLAKLWIPPHPGFFLRRDLFFKIGGFNQEYRLAADYDLILRALLWASRVDYLNIVTVKMRIGGATNRSWKNIVRQNIEISKIYKAVFGKFPLAAFLYKFYLRVIQYSIAGSLNQEKTK